MTHEELNAILARLEGVVVGIADTFPKVLPPGVRDVASAAIAAGDAAIKKNNPKYFPGIAAVATQTPDPDSPRAPIPVVDTDQSPLAAELPDVGSPEALQAYLVALNAKVDALIEAVGLGGSAAMADHH